MEQDGDSKRKMEALEGDMKAIRVEHESMGAKIRELEKEVSAEKAAFMEYKRKIRNLSMDP